MLECGEHLVMGGEQAEGLNARIQSETVCFFVFLLSGLTVWPVGS